MHGGRGTELQGYSVMKSEWGSVWGLAGATGGSIRIVWLCRGRVDQKVVGVTGVTRPIEGLHDKWGRRRKATTTRRRRRRNDTW